MAKTDLNIKITDAYGKSSTSKISYVNPEATDSQLVAFAQKVNQLTTNQLDSASKVTTTELSTAAKLPREITLDYPTVTLTEIKSATTENSAYNAMFNITSDGIEIYEDDPLALKGGVYIKEYTCCLPACIRYDESNGVNIPYPNLLVCYGNSYLHLGPTTGTITIAMPENEKYAYAEATLTITE